MRYAYCGSSFRNIGPWTELKERHEYFEKRPRTWEVLRYYLETPEKNHRTYCRGFLFQGSQTEPKELFSKDPLHDDSVIYVVRDSMPLGGRSYVPVVCNDHYQELVQEAEDLKSVTYNLGLKLTLSGSLTEEEQKVLRRREQVSEWISKMALQAGRHVTEQSMDTKDIVHHVTRDRLYRSVDHTTACTYSYVNVVPTYKCFTCMRVGHHHKDACFLFEKVVAEVGLKAGPTKFQSWISEEA